jgi:SAM-dependent methyltransferase
VAQLRAESHSRTEEAKRAPKPSPRYAARMPPTPGQPWFHAALQLLDLRREDRVLAMHADPEQVRNLAGLIGKGGELTVLQPDRSLAEAIAALELPQVEVLAHATSGDERFGSFDAMLVAPRTQPDWMKGAYAELPRRNLRPGGRLVLDLPAPDMVPPLLAACRELGLHDAALAPLCGLRDDELADILRNAGLRRVQALLGSHLIHLESPFDLADAWGKTLQLTEAQVVELGQGLVRRLGSTDACDVLVHRTRVQALR